MDNVNNKIENQEAVNINLEKSSVGPDQESLIDKSEVNVEHEAVIMDSNLENQTLQSVPAQPVPNSTQSEEFLSPEEEYELNEVENILEEDLSDVYNSLDPKTKADFKKQGEQTTRIIIGLLHKVHIKTRLIIKIIVKWLKIIPGLNRHFIEQEAKIKTDKIVEMHEEEIEHKHEQK